MHNPGISWAEIGMLNGIFWGSCLFFGYVVPFVCHSIRRFFRPYKWVKMGEGYDARWVKIEN